MKFKEVNYSTENRPEWLAWRHQGIGSSDAAVIMGVSRFKKRIDLLNEKISTFTGEDQSNEYIKNRGNKIETKVREFLEKSTGQTFAPMSCEMIDHTFIKATLDGATQDRKIITEIKLLSTQKCDKLNKEAEGYKKWVAAKKGKVPKEYYPQIQHQLMITGAEKCLFKGYFELRPIAGHNGDKTYYGDAPVDDDSLATIEVLPDEEYIKELFVEETKFWMEVQTKILMNKSLEYKGELE